MKFGGTSVGSAERMRIAAGIAAEPKPRRPVAIVVSAMSKITDLLLDTLRRAEAGDQPGLQANIAKLRERHLATCRELLPPERQHAAADGIAHLIAEFERIAGGMLMLNEMPPRSVDEGAAGSACGDRECRLPGIAAGDRRADGGWAGGSTGRRRRASEFRPPRLWHRRDHELCRGGRQRPRFRSRMPISAPRRFRHSSFETWPRCSCRETPGG